MPTKPLQRLSQALKSAKWRLPPTLATHTSGGANLEVFKFGMYIMFPIGWMYYFGVNLDTRFAVPDFWPQEGTTHRIPFEKEELRELGERLRRERLEKRRRRLEGEGGREGGREGDGGGEGERAAVIKNGEEGTFGVGSIDRWARGRWRD